MIHYDEQEQSYIAVVYCKFHQNRSNIRSRTYKNIIQVNKHTDNKQIKKEIRITLKDIDQNNI